MADKPKTKKSVHMTDYVRQCLKENPNGSLSKDVYEYCVKEKAPFGVKEPEQMRVSIAAQLSYLQARGEATTELVDNVIRWKSVKSRV